jgi:RNA polymerase sigma-54 factor
MTQKQMLVMTPKLQQAIKILQMPRLELSQHITQQLAENPILEIEETYDELDETSEETEKEGDESLIDIPESEVDLDTGLSETDSATEDDLPKLDITDDNFGDMDWTNYFEDSRSNNSEWEEPLEDERQSNIPVVEESLEDHLLWQLRMSTQTDSDYEIGEAIIGEINDDGYLITDVKEIAESSDYNVADVERLLELIQTFEPAGVGARNLRECLLIQLKQMNLEDSLAYKVVEGDYLEDLAANRHPQVAKILKVNLDSIREAITMLATLEPKPGRPFNTVRNENINPDVTVDKVDGKYAVIMNDYGPRLGLSPYYRNMQNSGDEDTRKYIQSQFESALWFLESIERRRRTIQKVTEAIFDVQSEFLEKGSKSLKPLTLREIADRVGVHEATVSRVVNKKYVQTPFGTFELKSFFSSGISKKSGEMASSTSVKEIIKNIVEGEDSQNPLSDEDIVKALSQKGFKIARRTIAKYREELNIPPSNKRKQW